MQFFYISSKNLIENKIMPATKPYLNNEIIPNFYSKIRFCGNEQSCENKKKKHKIMKKYLLIKVSKK